MAIYNGKEILFNPQITINEGGGELTASTGAEMSALLVLDNVGKVVKFVGEDTTLYKKDSFYLIKYIGGFAVGDKPDRVYFNTDITPDLSFAADYITEESPLHNIITCSGGVLADDGILQISVFTPSSEIGTSFGLSNNMYWLMAGDCQVYLQVAAEDVDKLSTLGIGSESINTWLHTDVSLNVSGMADLTITSVATETVEYWSEFVSSTQNSIVAELMVEESDIVDNKLPILAGVQSADNLYNITAKELGEITTIGAYAFYSKVGLGGIALDNITTIEGYAFHKCSNLEEIVAEKLTTLSGTSQFASCTKLKKFSAPLLKTIPERLFEETPIEELNCTELEIISGAYSMGGGSSTKSFIGKDLVFPKVTSVGQSAFYYCGAKSMSFPALVNSIGGFNIYQNPYLEQIDLPNMETMGSSYFLYQCTKIQSITLPKLKTFICYAIYGCTALKTIDLPMVTQVTIAKGTWAFNSMSNVRLLLRYDGVATLTGVTGSILPDAITEVYVPANQVENYKIATNWSVYADRIKSLDDFAG